MSYLDANTTSKILEDLSYSAQRSVPKTISFDIAMDAFFTTLTPGRVSKVGGGAFVSYVLRDYVRTNYGDKLTYETEYGTLKPLAWTAGLVGGAVKYAMKGQNPLLGAYNNFAYEVANDLAPYLNEVLGESLTETLVPTFIETSESLVDLACTGLLFANGYGAIVGGVKIGLMLANVGGSTYRVLSKHLPQTPEEYLDIIVGNNSTARQISYELVSTAGEMLYNLTNDATKLGNYTYNAAYSTVTELYNSSILEEATPTSEEL